MAYTFLRMLPLPDYPAALIEKIFRSLLDHFFLLCADRFFAAHNNHGWLQMYGLLSFCRALPEVRGTAAAAELATERTLTLCQTLLTQDGMLREHSPAYQAFAVTLLAHLRPMLSGHDGGPAASLDSLLKNMRTCLDCFITPDGELAALGDSLARPYDFIEGEVRSAASRMKADGLRLLPHSGYALLRLPSPGHVNDVSFLLLSGAFHSYTHKHCDDLSFVWSEGRQNILVDPGMQVSSSSLMRNGPLRDKGFFYSAPNCVYAQSAHAHNVVEINGETWSRLDTPYGVLPLHGQQLSERHWLLEGIWQRPEGFRQQRRLILSPGRWLLVLDNLDPLPDAPLDPATFTQWFHLDPSAELVERQKQAAVFDLSGGRRLHCRSLLPDTRLTSHKGEFSPRLQGWTADTFTTLHPAWAMGWHQDNMGCFSTLFSLIGPCLDGLVTEYGLSLTFIHGVTEQISWEVPHNDEN